MKLFSYEYIFKGIRNLGYDDYDKFKGRRNFLFLQPFGHFLRQNTNWRQKKINLTEMVGMYVECCAIPPTEIPPDKSARLWFYEHVTDITNKSHVALLKGKDFSQTEYDAYIEALKANNYKEKNISHQRLVIDMKTKTIVTGIVEIARI
jgi:hypothetical protein